MENWAPYERSLTLAPASHLSQTSSYSLWPSTWRGFRYHVPVLQSLQRYLRQHRLVRPGQRVGIAVSGGADSVALLRALASLAPELGVVPFVLHFNHNLRGPDSEADAAFVAALAAQLALDSAVESGDVAALAARFHLSIEAAGRRARYAFFRRAAAANRLDCVATAHTRDDQAETVLLRLLRGTGTSGLAGILRSCDLSAIAEPINAVPIDSAPIAIPPAAASADGYCSPRLIRPLLATSRQQVEQFLLSLGQPFRQDSSNLSQQFLRNRVRAHLLPALERDYNPQLRQALCETAEVAAAENTFLEELVSAALGPQTDLKAGIELTLLKAQPVALQRRMLRRLCQPYGLALDFAQLEALRNYALAARAGSFQLPRGFAAEMIRPKLLPPRLRLLPPKTV